jgi:hypothetical protein
MVVTEHLYFRSFWGLINCIAGLESRRYCKLVRVSAHLCLVSRRHGSFLTQFSENRKKLSTDHCATVCIASAVIVRSVSWPTAPKQGLLEVHDDAMMCLPHSIYHSPG